MASIKERAAALNLDEKLCVRPQGEPLIAPRGGLQMRRVLPPADEALLQAFPGAQRLTSALLPIRTSTRGEHQISAVILRLEQPHPSPQGLRGREAQAGTPQVLQRLLPGVRGCGRAGGVYERPQRPRR